MKNIKTLIALVYVVNLLSCGNTEYKSKEHSNKIDFSLIDQKIDSTQSLYSTIDSKIYRRMHIIDSVFYKENKPVKIEQSKYDEIKDFEKESYEIENLILSFISHNISKIEDIYIEQADTLRPFNMKNRGDKGISYKYTNENIFSLTVKIKSFFTKYKIQKLPNFEKLEQEMLNKEMTFEDRYFILKVLINQLKNIEYDYYEDVINQIK